MGIFAVRIGQSRRQRRHPNGARFSGREISRTAPLWFPAYVTNVISLRAPIRDIIGAMNSPIDLKHLITRIPFKVEPKLDGGFIARASDPSVTPIEAPTREELHQKIVAALRAEFPQLNAPNGQNIDLSVQLRAGNDDFSVSSNPNESAGTENPIDLANPALEKVLNFAAKHLAPELAKQLAEQGGATSFQVRINNKTAIRVNAGSQGLTFGDPQNQALQNAPGGFPKLDAAAGLIDGHPITPEPSNIGKIFKIIVWAISIGALAYIYVLSRH